MILKQSELNDLLSTRNLFSAIQAIFEGVGNVDALPLEESCLMGGAPDPEDYPEIEVVEAQIHDGECVGKVSVAFNEVHASGEMHTAEARQVELHFRVCLRTRAVTFTRHYRPYGPFSNRGHMRNLRTSQTSNNRYNAEISLCQSIHRKH